MCWYGIYERMLVAPKTNIVFNGPFHQTPDDDDSVLLMIMMMVMVAMMGLHPNLNEQKKTYHYY